MNAKCSCENGVTKLLINDDRIDIQNANELRETLVRIIHSGQNRILLDLQKVNFIDSSGLGALVYGLREAQKTKGKIQVSKLSEHVSSMFTITRLNKIFDIIS